MGKKLTTPLSEESKLVSETPVSSGEVSAPSSTWQPDPNLLVKDEDLVSPSEEQEKPAEDAVVESESKDESLETKKGEEDRKEREKDKGEERFIPYHRFAEVIAERNALREKLQSLQPQTAEHALTEEKLEMLNEKLREMIYENPMHFFTVVAPSLMKPHIDNVTQYATTLAQRQATIDLFAQTKPDFKEVEPKMIELAPMYGHMAVNPDGTINLTGLERLYQMAKAGGFEKWVENLKKEAKREALEKVSSNSKGYVEAGKGSPLLSGKSFDELTVEEMEKILPRVSRY